MTITLSINGKLTSVDDGASVLDAVNRSGTYIPQLCKDPDMKAIGACRTCLVQIDGVRGFPASCSTPAAEGMSVITESDEARGMRRGVLELTLGMFPSIGANGGGNGVHGSNGDAAGGVGDYRELSIAAKHHGLEADGGLNRAFRAGRGRRWTLPIRCSILLWTPASCAGGALKPAKTGISSSARLIFWARGRTRASGLSWTARSWNRYALPADRASRPALPGRLA